MKQNKEFVVGEICVQEADNGNIRFVRILKRHGEILGIGHGKHYDIEALTNWYRHTNYGQKQEFVRMCHDSRLRKNEQTY